MNQQVYIQNLVNWLKAHGVNVGAIIIVTLVALKAVAILNRRLVARLFKHKQEAESQKLAQTVGTALRWLTAIILIGVAFSLILAQTGLNMRRVSDRALDWALTNGISIAIIIALTFVATRVAAFVSNHLALITQRGKFDPEAQKRAQTLGSVVRWASRAVILSVSFVMILGQIGVQIGPVLAAAGVIGVAVGFGAQHLVQDVISGFFILLEDQIRVGDVVQLNDKGGLVERVTLRMVILRDFSGSVHYIRNGKIDVVTNMTKDYSYYPFDIGIAYREDADEVSKVIKAIGAELQQDPEFKDDILEPIELVGLDKFADSAVIIKGRFKTRPSKQWRVGREFNRRLKRKFDELNIEIPFPHVTFYPGRDKRADPPPLKSETFNAPPRP